MGKGAASHLDLLINLQAHSGGMLQGAGMPRQGGDAYFGKNCGNHRKLCDPRRDEGIRSGL